MCVILHSCVGKMMLIKETGGSQFISLPLEVAINTGCYTLETECAAMYEIVNCSEITITRS